jgi:hypothetical protein
MMRSRIATAAVAATLVAGLGACSSTSKGAAGGAPTAAGTSASATVPSATATTPTSAPSAGSTTSGGSDAFTATQLETMRSKVAEVFGRGVTASSIYVKSPVDSTGLAADFDSAATMNAVWGSAGAASDRPMDCGMAKYNGVAIGSVKASGDNAATVQVLLYEGAKAGTAEITVALDPASGVIKGTTCGGAPDPADFPGIAPIGTYYGATANVDLSVVNNKQQPYFTSAFAAWHPADQDYDKPTCSQNGPDRWIVALTGTTSASSSWDFAPETVRSTPDPQTPAMPVGFYSSLAVDLGSNKISRVTCDEAYPPKADSAHQAEYARALMDYYSLAADQKSLGVDAEAAIRPFFVSDAAFTKAWADTGAVPLLCAKKVPGAVQVANGTTPTSAGSTTTVKLVTWPQWHPDNPGQELSKFTVTLDTSTMKIASITCTK